MTTHDTPVVFETQLPPTAESSNKHRGPGATLIHAFEAKSLPTSFGVFKPIGHVMIGLSTQTQTDALVIALQIAGWSLGAVRQFSPLESIAELRAMVDNAGLLAGLGYEITLLRRYLALAEQGTLWLLVKADNNERAASIAQAARSCGATLAVYYRTLTVEELIT